MLKVGDVMKDLLRVVEYVMIDLKDLLKRRGIEDERNEEGGR